MFQFFREVIALRHAHPALRRGRFDQLYAHARQYAFVSHDGAETLLVVLNATDEPADLRLPVSPYLSNGQSLQSILGEVRGNTVQDGHLDLSVPPRSGAVLS